MIRTLSYPKERIRVLLLEGIHESAVRRFAESGYSNVTRLEGSLPRPDLLRELRDVYLLGIRSRTHVDEAVFEAAPKLLAVGCFCIGTNQVDLAAAAVRGIPVFNAPHANTRSVAEVVLGYAIMLLRGVFPKNADMHAGVWRKTARGSHELRGKTLGIVGYGHIGSQVSILAEAFGMRVLYNDIEPKLPLGNAQSVDALDDLLASADVVTLHVPQTPETVGLIGAERLGRMKKGACLINTSRGSVVDLDALAARLREGSLAGAAVDVFPKEPARNGDPFDAPLRGVPTAILTPHTAGATVEAQQKIGDEVAHKLVRYSDRGTTTGAVNFPQLNLEGHDGAHRILHMHRNVPGILHQINEAIAEAGINVVGQHLQTTRDVGYVVLDIEKGASEPLLRDLRAIDGTIRARILY